MWFDEHQPCFRNTSTSSSFLEDVSEGTSQAPGKASLIQLCHSGLRIFFYFPNTNTKCSSRWCRKIASKSLSLQTISDIFPVRDGSGNNSSGNLSLSSILHSLEMRGSKLRQRQYQSHTAFRKMTAYTTSDLKKKYLSLLKAHFSCGVNHIMKRRHFMTASGIWIIHIMIMVILKMLNYRKNI